jgi:hypothetical protein
MLSRYDLLCGRELKNEVSKRFGTNKGKKPALPINRNQAAYKYRLVLLEDDLKKGIDPYLKIEPAPATVEAQR